MAPTARGARERTPGQRTFSPLPLYGQAAGRFRPTSQPTSPRPCSRYQRPAMLARPAQQQQQQQQQRQCRHHRRRVGKMSPDPQRGLPTTPYQGSGGRSTTTQVCHSAMIKIGTLCIPEHVCLLSRYSLVLTCVVCSKIENEHIYSFRARRRLRAKLVPRWENLWFSI